MKLFFKVFYSACFIFSGFLTPSLSGEDVDISSDEGPLQYQVITASQYADFLNTVAVTDTHFLYQQQMERDSLKGSIVREGGPGYYHYIVIEGRENLPVNYVSTLDAMRYCNWYQYRYAGDDRNLETTEEGVYCMNRGDQTVPPPKEGSSYFIGSDKEFTALASNSKHVLMGSLVPSQLLLFSKGVASTSTHWVPSDTGFMLSLGVSYLLLKAYLHIREPLPLEQEGALDQANPMEAHLEGEAVVMEHEKTALGDFRRSADAADLTRRDYLDAYNNVQAAVKQDKKTTQYIQSSAISYTISYAATHLLKTGIATAFPPAAVVLYGSDAIMSLCPGVAEGLARVVLGLTWDSAVALPIRGMLNAGVEPIVIGPDDSLQAEHPVEYLCPKVVRYSLKWFRDRTPATSIRLQLAAQEDAYQNAIKKVDQDYAKAVAKNQSSLLRWWNRSWEDYLLAAKSDPRMMTQEKDKAYYRFYTAHDQVIGAHLVDKTPSTILIPKKEAGTDDPIYFQKVLVPKGTRLKKLTTTLESDARGQGDSNHEFLLWDLIPAKNFEKGIEWKGEKDLDLLIQEREEDDEWDIIDPNIDPKTE